MLEDDLASLFIFQLPVDRVDGVVNSSALALGRYKVSKDDPKKVNFKVGRNLLDLENRLHILDKEIKKNKKNVAAISPVVNRLTFKDKQLFIGTPGESKFVDAAGTGRRGRGRGGGGK